MKRNLREILTWAALVAMLALLPGHSRRASAQDDPDPGYDPTADGYQVAPNPEPSPADDAAEQATSGSLGGVPADETTGMAGYAAGLERRAALIEAQREAGFEVTP